MLRDFGGKQTGKVWIGGPGSERPFVFCVRARALTGTPAGRPLQQKLYASRRVRQRLFPGKRFVEFWIRSGPQFIDVNDLPQVITEVLHNVIDRLKRRDIVLL